MDRTALSRGDDYREPGCRRDLRLVWSVDALRLLAECCCFDHIRNADEGVIEDGGEQP